MPAPIPFADKAQKNTWGGFQSATIYSGAVVPSLACAPGAVAGGSDVLFVSGAGRLDSIQVRYATLFSGFQLPIEFYDAGTVTSGGPFALSGHKIIASLPPLATPVSGLPGAVSGLTFNPPSFGPPIQISAPFQSGLCYNSRSGQPGITVFWTPEPAGQ